MTKLDIPPPFKMDPNAWEVGYYDGYTDALDQRFWSSDNKQQRADYRRGWREAQHHKFIEEILAGKARSQHKRP